MIKKIKKQIDKNLQEFMIKIEKQYRFSEIHPVLAKSLFEYSTREGKRIRPLLNIISYKGYLPKNKKMHPSLYNVSCAIELLHNFMLIHDDIIDCSNLRRGKPTMHILLQKVVNTNKKEKLGNDLAIIAGDLLYAFAIDAFISVTVPAPKKEKALKYFIETTTLTAIGEFIDTVHGFEKISKIKEKDVYLNYSYKTARYTFIAPMVIGAILAGAKETEIKKLTQLGMLIGQAFQIQDDIIGIFDQEKNIGKSLLSDIQEAKKTLLVIKTFEKLSPKKRKIFADIFDKKKKTYKDLIAIRKIFIEAKSLEYNLSEMELRIKKSQKILHSLEMKQENKLIIGELIQKIFQHSHRIALENNLKIDIQ